MKQYRSSPSWEFEWSSQSRSYDLLYDTVLELELDRTPHDWFDESYKGDEWDAEVAGAQEELSERRSDQLIATVMNRIDTATKRHTESWCYDSSLLMLHYLICWSPLLYLFCREIPRKSVYEIGEVAVHAMQIQRFMLELYIMSVRRSALLLNYYV